MSGTENLVKEFKIRMGLKFISVWLLVLFTARADAQVGSKKSMPIVYKNDSVLMAASYKYVPNSFLRRVIIGNNYRKEWAEPVTVPVFHLSKTGLKITELGGGMQTKSLRLVDKYDREWAIRSVDKDAAGALPKNIRNPLTVKVVQDMISAAHPYAALIVGDLAKSAGIIAPNPTLYFIPDDPAFGKYRQIFANTLCFLEQREPTPDHSEAEDTEDVLEEIVEEADHLVLQKSVLKARLLDMLVADWDRHEDQWKWGSKDSSKRKYYYVIPRDRDQALFMSNGLLPRLAKLFGMRHINWFKNESRGIKQLSFKAWGFDKTFLNELDEKDWKQVIEKFTKSLTDEKIAKAVKRLPAEIYAIDGQEIEQKLISRRNTLEKNALKYYRFISGTVDISGSEESELFVIKSKDDSLTVSMYEYKNGARGKKLYQRTFNPKETGFVYLNGLGGNDHFVTEDNGSSRIKIKIHGGDGSDVYDIKGKLKAEVFDFSAEKNTIAKGQ